MCSKISIVRCTSYNPALVQEKVKEAVNLIGGVSHYVKPESKVLVKPNLLMAKEPASGIDTHPEIVRAVIRILKEIGCEIFIGDGPSVWGKQAQRVDEVYERSGIKRISDEEKVTLVTFEHARWRGSFPLTTWLDNCDYLINVPKFKTHELMLLTGAIKNLFGLVSGTYKTQLHKNYFNKVDFSKVLVDIYSQAQPALTIVDGITAMEADGPATGGSLRQLNLLLAGQDCVAIDSVMALLMGIKPVDVETTKEAANRKMGAVDIKDMALFGEKLDDMKVAPFILPKAYFKNKFPPVIIALIKNFIKFYPRLVQSKCIGCAACIRACPHKIVTMKHNRIVFDYSKCISCFCCQEVCPASAITVEKSLFAKIIGL